MVEAVPGQNDRFGIHRRLWIALFELLEAEGFEVYLWNRGNCRVAAPPKTDVLNAQCDPNGSTPTVSCGRRFGLPIPCSRACLLAAADRCRSLRRSHAQHMQKALEQINVKLTEVVNDITGVTGMSIIGAILEGERDPVKLAQLRDRRCQSSEDQIALALQGTWPRTSLRAAAGL